MNTIKVDTINLQVRVSGIRWPATASRTSTEYDAYGYGVGYSITVEQTKPETHPSYTTLVLSDVMIVNGEPTFSREEYIYMLEDEFNKHFGCKPLAYTAEYDIFTQ